jgi:hypothetical protein
MTALFLVLTDPTPAPNDVKAGWTAFLIFLLLAAAVVVLAFSLVKQLRKAQAAKDAGVYGDTPATDVPDGSDDPTG